MLVGEVFIFRLI